MKIKMFEKQTKYNFTLLLFEKDVTVNDTEFTPVTVDVPIETFIQMGRKARNSFELARDINLYVCVDKHHDFMTDIIKDDLAELTPNEKMWIEAKYGNTDGE